MLERFKMREGWLALILVFLLLFTITLSLQAAQWAPGLNILFSIFLIAFMVGIIFAKSNLSGLLMHPLALSIGTLWIAYQSLELTAEQEWEAQLAALIVRLIKWYRHFANQETSSDTLPFVILMAILVWLITYSSVWYFYRERNIWGVLLPSGVTILVNTYYANNALSGFLLFYLMLAFLLVIRTNLLDQEERWQQSDIFYSSDIQFDFFREGAIFAIAVVAIAWLLPSAISSTDINPLYAKLSQPWNQAQQEWNRIFSSLNYRGTAATGTWFGTSMSFHGPLNRSDRLVMNVKADEGRYWRAVVLDEYTSAGWAISSRTLTEKIEANSALVGEETIAGRAKIAQDYTIYSPAGVLLFAAGQALEVDLDTQVLLGGPAASSVPVSPHSFSQLYAQEAIYQGQAYSVVSAIPTIDGESLRLTGQDYPEWLKEHYTALPETLPTRVRELANEIAGDSDNPYDAAKKIEQYLRTIPYNELISGPNPGEDGVDYFLFREQQGYCDYYASSMAVMLRSLGIPARIAQGYSQGQQTAPGEYEVRQTNAHTWLEAYFPGYGWLEFEPTAAEPALQRPLSAAGEEEEEEEESTPSDPNDSNEEDLLAEQEMLRRQQEERLIAEPSPANKKRWVLPFDSRLLMIPLSLMAILGVIGAGGWLLIQRRWRGLGIVERLYDQLILIGRAQGTRLDPTLTPHEYAERLGKQVPPVQKQMTRLADLFSKQRFSDSALEEEEIAEAKTSWSTAWRPLLREAIKRPNNKKE